MADSKISWSRTAGKGELTKLTHKWTIDDFTFMTEKLSSSTFSGGYQNEEQWCIHAYPMGFNESAKDYLSIFIYRQTEQENELNVKIKFSLFTSKNQEIEDTTIEGTRTYSKTRREWGSLQVIPRATLLKEVAEDDKLLIVCHLTYKITTTIEIKGGPTPQFELPRCTLHENLGILLETESYSDVTLVVENDELQAHKNILAAQSSVFAVIFQHEELAESKKNVVKIDDIAPEVVKEMLRFMYTGETPNLSLMAESLLAAAEKYALDRLKIMCEKSLYENLTFETAARTLYVADLYNASQLKRYVIEFICANPTIIEAEYWKDTILDRELLNEVMKAICKKLASVKF